MKSTVIILSIVRTITFPTASAALLAMALTSDARGADLKLPIAAGPFKPTHGFVEATTSVPNGSATPSSASGRTGDRRPCRWTATGTPAACTSRATSTTSIISTHYGHPSEFGYKDIIPLWKAEKWDPDRLMELYKKAGAKYFVSMGSHHDNFFLWNSKLHRWNAVEHGPATRRGRRLAEGGAEIWPAFGVSEHLGASFTWFQSSHGADKTGPEGGRALRRREPEVPGPLSFPGRARRHGLVQQRTRSGSSSGTTRSQDLVDNYHPDLLYSDGGVPFGNEVGLQHDRPPLQHQRGRATAASSRSFTTASRSPKAAGSRTSNAASCPGSIPYPWQTDTSIGDWFYDRNWKFRPVSWVIHMLVDNVSKNGNLLLNVVQRPDGSLDPEVEQMLAQLADWNAIHGEAIFGTRPWLVYGESAVKVEGRQLQGRLQVQRQGHPLHHQGRRRSTPSPWAGPRTASSSSARWPSRPARRSTTSPRQPARLRRQTRLEADRRGPGRHAAGAEGFRIHLRP